MTGLLVMIMLNDSSRTSVINYVLSQSFVTRQKKNELEIMLKILPPRSLEILQSCYQSLRKVGATGELSSLTLKLILVWHKFR